MTRSKFLACSLCAEDVALTNLSWYSQQESNLYLKLRSTVVFATELSFVVWTISLPWVGELLVWCLRQESNLYLALRRHSFYPLNYGGGTGILAFKPVHYGNMSH